MTIDIVDLRPTWRYFVLGVEKTPLPNCERCHNQAHRESCECLTCHGFYAATHDLDRLREMRRLHPHGAWAVRTGAASGITVLDAEGPRVDEPGRGVEVLDDWESWTGWSLPPTELVVNTPSGGLHLYYEYVTGTKSRNRVLPGVDIKSDGGYVVVPDFRSAPHRMWRRPGARLGVASADLAGWLQTVRGGPGGGVGAANGAVDYDYDRFLREGCPDGCRDQFFNELVFRSRKSGMRRGDTVVLARTHWKLVAQPPHARFYMPWSDVEYKIEHIWQTVEPDVVSSELARWAVMTRNRSVGPARTGRVTLVNRRRTAGDR